MPLALGTHRLLIYGIYGGYVMLAGALTFWTLVGPEGRRDHTLVTMIPRFSNVAATSLVVLVVTATMHA